MNYCLRFQVAVGAGVDLQQLSTGQIHLSGERVNGGTPEEGTDSVWNMEVPNFLPSAIANSLGKGIRSI